MVGFSYFNKTVACFAVKVSGFSITKLKVSA